MGPEKNTSQPPPPHLNRQKPPLPPHLNPQQQQPPPRQQVQIYHILPPKVYHTDAANFKSLVQRLTGLNSHTPSPPSTPPTTFDAPRGESLSPASRVAATENANRAVQRSKTPSGILSPGPSFSPPSITPDFFQDFLYPSAIIEEELRDRQIQHREEPLISSISDDDNPSKRPRFEFGGNDMHNYLSQDQDLYPQNMVISSMSMNELMNWHNGQQDLIGKPRRKLFPLPQGPFSNTLFVEGFPSDCSEREVAHVFRHFYGFKEVRVIVMTDYSKQTNVDPPVVCIAEFESPVSAACAFAALQGYQMDVNEHDSKFLQIQFF
ncbi:unnamed protein product [Cochlearia groenlandica]